MHGNGAGGIERDIIPHPPVNFRRGENRSGVLHQKAKDIVLLGGKGDWFAIHGDRFGVIIQLYPADNKAGGAHRTAPQLQIAPQLAAYPGQHFYWVKGLGDVVIRADIKP